MTDDDAMQPPPTPADGDSTAVPKWGIAAFCGAILVGVIAYVGWSGSTTNTSSSATTESTDISTPRTTTPRTTAAPEWEYDCPGSDRRVIYFGEGSARSVSFTAQVNGGSSQGETSLPVTNTKGQLGLRQCMAPSDFVYFSIQNQDDYGDVTCKIEVDGRMISSVRSAGAYVIATCSGMA